jgi:hypothetical protein
MVNLEGEGEAVNGIHPGASMHRLQIFPPNPAGLNKVDPHLIQQCYFATRNNLELRLHSKHRLKQQQRINTATVSLSHPLPILISDKEYARALLSPLDKLLQIRRMADIVLCAGRLEEQPMDFADVAEGEGLVVVVVAPTAR